MDSNVYRILSLQITNARTIEAVDITPRGDLIEIQGQNGNGKTTILDMIELAFKRSSLDDRIVRKGEEQATSLINLGPYVIKRVIRKDKTPTIEIRNTETGKKIDRPAEEFISEITGKKGKRPIALDIAGIVGMDGPERLALLMECAGIDTTKLAELNTKHTDLADNRKAEKKNLERAETAMKEVEKYAFPVDAPPDAANLMAKQKEIAAQRQAWQKKREEAETALKDADKFSAEIAELQNKIEAAKKKRDEAKGKHDLLVREIADGNDAALAKEEIEISAQAASIAETSEKYQNHKKYVEKKGEWQKQSLVLQKVEKEVDAVIAAKKGLLESGKYPTPNLTVQDGEIYFKGTHWGQLSESERLKVALAIANGLNPQLRVLLVRDGNAFDDNAMKQIATWAKTNDFQVWIERVASIPTLGTDAVYIVEGEAIGEEEKAEIIRKKTKAVAENLDAQAKKEGEKP